MRVVAVLSYPDIYNDHKGNVAYLDHIVASLQDNDFKVVYLAPKYKKQINSQENRYVPTAFNEVFYFYEKASLKKRIKSNFSRLLNKVLFIFGLAPTQKSTWRKPVLSEAFSKWAVDLLAELKCDYVISNYFNCAQLFPQLPVTTITCILTHDIFSLRKRTIHSAFMDSDFDESMLIRENEAFRRADLVLTIQSKEQQYLLATLPEIQVFNVHHGLKMPQIDTDTERNPVVLFTGSLNHPNIDGLNWFLNYCWIPIISKQKDSKLIVVGSVCGAFDKSVYTNVDFVGVQDKIDVYLQAAKVSVVPLRMGSGLKIKLVESLAWGIPTVSTSVGVEGIENASGHGVYIRNDASEFAETVLFLLNETKQSQLRLNARAFAEMNFNRDTIGKELAQKLVDVQNQKTLK